MQQSISSKTNLSQELTITQQNNSSYSMVCFTLNSMLMIV